MKTRLTALAFVTASFFAGTALAASEPSAAPADASKIEPIPGYDHLEVHAPYRGETVLASIWYPASDRTYAVPIGENPIFFGTGRARRSGGPDRQTSADPSLPRLWR